MDTYQKVSLEIPDSLMEKIERLAKASDQSPESLIFSCIYRTLPQVEEDVNKLEAFLAKVTPENIHEAIDFGEPVDREFW